MSDLAGPTRQLSHLLLACQLLTKLCCLVPVLKDRFSGISNDGNETDGRRDHVDRRTRTPMDCFGSSCPRALICRARARSISITSRCS